LFAADEKFFDTHTAGRGVWSFNPGTYQTQGVIQVPVIALFTKSDGLESKAFHDLRDEGLSRREAKDKLTKYAHNILTDSVMKPIMATRFPPSDIVILKGTLSIASCRRTDS
jgi:hypothetical protein